MSTNLTAQTILGDLDLTNDRQTHILTTKIGERYPGRVILISKKDIVFRPSGLTNVRDLEFERNQVATIEVFLPNDDNGGKLREPFLGIKIKYPDMLLDSKLELSNFSQKVQLIYDDFIHKGKIHKIRKNGLELSKSNRIVFFPFKKISKISVIEQEVDLTPPENLAFQVDSLPMSEVTDSIWFDPIFDVNQPKQRHLLLTNRGDKIVGQVDSLGDNNIYFKMKNGGELQFDRKEVERVEVYLKGYVRKEKDKKVDYKKRKKFIGKNYILAQNRLLISPTGFGLKKGETEYRSIQAFINGFDYGVSDNLTIGVGFYPLVGDNMLTGRFNLSTDIGKFVHLSGGAQFIYGLGGLANSGSGAGLYTVHLASSIGTPRTYINIAYNHWEGLQKTRKGDILSVGFSAKIGKSYRLFSDILFTKEEEEDRFSVRPDLHKEEIISIGGSWFNLVNKVDFGLTLVPGLWSEISSDFLLVPFGSYVRRF